MHQAVAAAKRVEEIRLNSAPPIPDGWFTREDYEIHNKCARTKAMTDIMRLAKLDELEISSWPTLDSRGYTKHKPIYRLKK